MPDNQPHNALRYHVSGAIERGEKEPITAIEADPYPERQDYDGYQSYVDAKDEWEERHDA